jgi:uncharacterized OsmC-like protein
MSTTPTKQWSIQVVSPKAGSLRVLRGAVPLDLNHIGPGEVTPVELLLISIATCFALSCHAAFPLRQQTRTTFEVEVSGAKAAQRPSRLSEVSLNVRFAAELPVEEARRVAELAKQMCTVTNTMAAATECRMNVSLA